MGCVDPLRARVGNLGDGGQGTRWRCAQLDDLTRQTDASATFRHKTSRTTYDSSNLSRPPYNPAAAISAAVIRQKRPHVTLLRCFRCEPQVVALITICAIPWRRGPWQRSKRLGGGGAGHTGAVAPRQQPPRQRLHHLCAPASHIGYAVARAVCEPPKASPRRSKQCKVGPSCSQGKTTAPARTDPTPEPTGWFDHMPPLPPHIGASSSKTAVNAHCERRHCSMGARAPAYACARLERTRSA